MGFTGTSGQTPFSAAGFGRATSISNEQDSVYVEHGRPRVTFTTNINLHDESARNMSGPEQLVFLEHTATSLRFNAQPVQLNTHGNEFKKLIGLGQLNRQLREKADVYSPNKADPTDFFTIYQDKLLERFSFWGVQETDTITNKNYASRNDAAVTSYIAHRAITPDVWLSTGRAPMPGDQLWLLWRMYPLQDHPQGINQAWGLFPFVTKQNEEPPTSAYSTPANELRKHKPDPKFIGGVIYIGVVVDRKNAISSNSNREDGESKWRGPAFKACFPRTKPEDSVHELSKCLPKVEVMLRCK
jgi:hypothetical protein